MGWGSLAEATQFSQEGKVVWHARLGERREMIGSMKVFKRPWSAMPSWRPDGYAFSWGCGWQTVVYASWNGATGVRTWRFYGGNKTEDIELLGETRRDGFETMFKTGVFVRVAVLEAVGEEGRVLGRSEVVRTFVPEMVESRGCGEERCPETLEGWVKDVADSCFEGIEEARGMMGKSQVVLEGF